MAVEVEIYDERELDSETLIPEPTDEAVALLQELGLTNQLSIVKKADKEVTERVTHPTPTDIQRLVMEGLFPSATKLEDYRVGCIPLRVLKEIKVYKQEHPDHVIVIRHVKNNQMKDPIVIAYTRPEHKWMATHENPGSSWSEFRMIARWGDGLEDWNTLYKKAKKVISEGTLEALNEIISKCTIAKQMIQSGIMPKNSNTPTVNHVDELFRG